jgi:hypothetical protein
MMAIVRVEGNDLAWVRIEDDSRLLAHKTILAIDNEALIALPGFSASAVAQRLRWVANPWID